MFEEEGSDSEGDTSDEDNQSGSKAKLSIDQPTQSASESLSAILSQPKGHREGPKATPSTSEGTKEKSMSPLQDPQGRRDLRVGTDCSGMEAPIQALRNMRWPHDHVFSCDNDATVLATIKANFTPTIHFHDIKKRAVKDTPSVDLYVAGFPCQPFSSAGKQQGFEDTKGRGNIFYNVLEYIETHRPKVFILEIVKGLLTMDRGRNVKKILAALHDVKFERTSAYEIHHEILDTKNHGIPHSRPRWYCVGILKSTFSGDFSQFKFPGSIPMTPIDSLLDWDEVSLPKRSIEAELWQKTLKGPKQR